MADISLDVEPNVRSALPSNESKHGCFGSNLKDRLVQSNVCWFPLLRVSTELHPDIDRARCSLFDLPSIIFAPTISSMLSCGHSIDNVVILIFLCPVKLNLSQ